MEALETTIRQHLVSYLAGEISPEDFTDWLVGMAWNIEHTGNASARELTYSIELALAEASSGLWTPDELHAELRALLEPATVSLPTQP